MTNTRPDRYRADRRASTGLGTALIALTIVAAVLLGLAVLARTVVAPAISDLNDQLSNPTTATQGVTP